MSKPVTIDLMIDGEVKHFEETFVPLAKHIEMLEMNERVANGEFTELQWIREKAKFVASIFSDSQVTEDTVINGLNSADAEEKMETIIGEMMGVDPNVMTEIPTA